MGKSHAVLDAKSIDDCIVPQNWGAYTEQEHETWKFLFKRQMGVLKGNVCEEYLDSLETLGITANKMFTAGNLHASWGEFPVFGHKSTGPQPSISSCGRKI